MTDKISIKFQLNAYLAYKKCSINTKTQVSLKQNANNEFCSNIEHTSATTQEPFIFTFTEHLCVLSIRAEDHPIFSGRWTG